MMCHQYLLQYRLVLKMFAVALYQSIYKTGVFLTKLLVWQIVSFVQVRMLHLYTLLLLAILLLDRVDHYCGNYVCGFCY